MNRIGVVTGLKMEAALLQGRAERVACTGAQPGRAEAEAERLIASGADALLSFGLAGGLDRGLEPGALILAGTVVDGSDRRIATDPAWLEAVGRRAGALSHRMGAIVESSRILATAAEKQALAQRSGALAVDMESYAVAEVAARHAVPFLAVRAITDPVTRNLPGVALVPLSADGGIRLGAVLRRLASDPGDWPNVWASARDTRAGLAALRRVLGALDLARL